jgi:predicted RNase H-like nuclease
MVNPHYLAKGSTCIIGFDSAWTDNSKAPGAICALVIASDGGVRFKPPCHVSFDQALAFIDAERCACDTCLVAIDQPTIVPNESGSRPADKVAASLVSFIGGGVQPANRSKKEMFGDDAPIWRFLKRLGATEDPELSRTADRGLFIIEVFPALALAAFETRFSGRMKAPKYNPGNKGSFGETIGSTLSRPSSAMRVMCQSREFRTGRWRSSARPPTDRPAKGIKIGSTPFCAL